MDVTNEAINLIFRVEGVKTKAYLDQGGVATIGTGTTVYPNGRKVRLGDICTLLDAKLWLQDHLAKNVYPILKAYENAPDAVYVAMCSFVYNVGHLGQSIIKALNDKNWTELANAMREYNKVDGKVNVGLVNRREIEIKYMMGGV